MRFALLRFASSAYLLEGPPVPAAFEEHPVRVVEDLHAALRRFVPLVDDELGADGHRAVGRRRGGVLAREEIETEAPGGRVRERRDCLLYTSDAADE